MIENTILQGNCIDVMQTLDEESVDLIFADPPFNIGYKYADYTDSLTPDQYLCFTKDWLDAADRVIADTGSIWVAIGPEYAAELCMELKEMFHLRSWVIWYYTFGVNCKNNFSRSHTHLLYATRDKKEFTFNADAIKVPSMRQLMGDLRADPSGRIPDSTWFLRPQQLPGEMASGDDVWHFPRICGTFSERAGWHGCQMPERLLGRIVRACSNPGDLVLDPFSGTASTSIVAKKLGRRYLGIELSPEYHTKSIARLDAASVGQPLAGEE